MQADEEQASPTSMDEPLQDCKTAPPDKRTGDEADRSADKRPEAATDPKFWWRRTRVHVALLGLAIAVVNCYAQATFCISIVEMVLPADYVVKPAESVAPPRDAASNRTVDSGPPPPHVVRVADQSCPIECKYRDYYESWRFPSAAAPSQAQCNGNASQAPAAAATSTTVDVSNRFNWDSSQQGLLLGAFAVGTAPLQVLAGRLAEIYGAKWLLLAGCIGTALTNLTIPYIAHLSFILLLLNRVTMGVAQAAMEPGLMCLLAHWLTPQEASFFISMLLFAICVGFFLGSLCSSFILGLGYGWPLTYYVSGGLNLLVGLAWHLYADSWPRVSQHIGQSELEHIGREQRRAHDLSRSSIAAAVTPLPLAALAHPKQPLEGSQSVFPQEGGGVLPVADGEPARAPWRNILSTPSVWAFIICKISVRWCADVLSNELPTYLANVLHLSIKLNGLLNSISSALFAVSSFVTGYLANEISVADARSRLEAGRPGACSKTRVRKLFQSVASFGSAICIILMTRYDCDIILSMSMLLILSCCLVMGTGGELQIPYDMTSRYPGTLHGMACTLSVSGWLAPPLIGLVLGDQPSSRARWSIVWYSTAAINLIGGLVFVLFADASPKDFDVVQTGGGEQSAGAPAEDDDDINGSQTRGYCNVALSNSSTENSPKSNHHQAGNFLQHNQIQAPLFDGIKLLKLSQHESSFVSPQDFCYPPERDLDLPMNSGHLPSILPFREQTQTATTKRKSHDKGSPTLSDGHNENASQSDQIKATHDDKRHREGALVARTYSDLTDDSTKPVVTNLGELDDEHPNELAGRASVSPITSTHL